MPAAPLIDLSTVDLDASVGGPAEIERVNPHRGAMRLLDRVIWMAEDLSAAIGFKDVRSDEFWVPGHIPGRPLYPGVLMVESAAQLCSYLLKIRAGEDRFLGFTRIENTSFRGQVVPGDRLLLVVKEIVVRPRGFRCAGQGLVDDRIVFETEISGMAM